MFYYQEKLIHNRDKTLPCGLCTTPPFLLGNIIKETASLDFKLTLEKGFVEAHQQKATVYEFWVGRLTIPRY